MPHAHQATKTQLRKKAIEKFIDRSKSLVAVYLVLFNPQNEVLLYKRQNTGFADDKYGLVGGHVEKHEGLRDALIRETKEEIGIVIDDKDLVHMTTMQRFSYIGDILDFFFFCDTWKGEIANLEPEKCAELKFFDCENLPHETLIYIKRGIRAVKERREYVLYGWDDQDKIYC